MRAQKKYIENLQNLLQMCLNLAYSSRIYLPLLSAVRERTTNPTIMNGLIFASFDSFSTSSRVERICVWSVGTFYVK